MSPVFLLLLTLLPSALLGQERPPTPVIVAEVLEQPLVEDLSFVGRIQPRRSSRVATETEGRVIRRFKEAGQAVRAGDPLFKLANDPLQAALAEAQADFALRQFNHDRSRQLRATDAVSEQDLRDDAYELARAQAKLAGLQAQVEDLFVPRPLLRAHHPDLYRGWTMGRARRRDCPSNLHRHRPRVRRGPPSATCRSSPWVTAQTSSLMPSAATPSPASWPSSSPRATPPPTPSRSSSGPSTQKAGCAAICPHECASRSRNPRHRS